MTSSNYQTNSVDLDSTYIVGNDPNYQGIQSAVTNRKTVVFGQQLLTQTYPVGNLNNAINYAQTLPGIQVDQDSTTITGVGPTSVFYQSRANAQSLIRANFLLAENYPQLGFWQISNLPGIVSSPVQTQSVANGWTSIGSFYLGSALGIQSNGTLWSWGLNNAGQLGNNSTNTLINPTQVGALSNWARISCGYAFAAIQSNGTLWTWGYNNLGQLGVNTSTVVISSPVQVGALSVWSQIFCGYNTTYAIQSNGTLWAWGQGGQGQLGNLSTTNISSPVQIGTVSIWAKVLGSPIAGQYAIGLQSNGTLWSWGAGNNYYALGQGNLTSYSTPVQIGSTSTWSNIATGSFFTLALQNNGTLWSWGLNNAGQLGLNDQTTRSVPTQVGALSIWTQVACGYNYSLAIQTPGTLWSWGFNGSGITTNGGALGLGDVTNRSSPVQVGTLNYWTQVSSNARNNSLAIQSPGNLWSWGNNSYRQLGLTPLGISVTKVAYGL